jgi:hypothetical protein
MGAFFDDPLSKCDHELLARSASSYLEWRHHMTYTSDSGYSRHYRLLTLWPSMGLEERDDASDFVRGCRWFPKQDAELLARRTHIGPGDLRMTRSVVCRISLGCRCC